jgi:hypothetical protein
MHLIKNIVKKFLKPSGSDEKVIGHLPKNPLDPMTPQNLSV